ncbi:2,4-dienoyl-CoA reductase (NADPH) NDAI_0F03580 [Naumovozyma dairenensis CBS 421]|uniref:2,4-dienoyl-CoA reductase [(3E)-enoyl-CoA-producing] n=1 Tax=Naumovozyma dairenensis (strain ATCC 10597 / BCRC 20456 / CBS 421 / NBRC 0211 / NRRL Y-12639) TaxID=1071378 RepID=G0WD15_NAUDC|nr:hypothetical protein NDAI_0F03580 [Naumovozyma dairenensis CBS 421]CCD25676.1 hypothetical protein NDAI_0F03580 [Naumovozyma dairenensis CBS 421]
MGNTLDQSFVAESSWKPDLFKNKVVLVTGGAGTICRVQVEAMVLLGCKATIVGREGQKTVDAAKEIETLVEHKEGETIVLPIGDVDVRNFDQLQMAVKKTVETFGHLDYVIAGAAGNFICDVVNLSANAFKSVVDIDLLGSFNTVKACTPELVKSKGSILFVSATFHYYGVPFQSHVGAAKAGIDALSQNLAVELGPLGIRSNCIAPGAIDQTEGFKRLSGTNFKEESVKRIPLQRLGKTRDIAEATVYLFSPASAYVTGTVQIVDGGMWHTGTYFTNTLYPDKLLESMKSKL